MLAVLAAWWKGRFRPWRAPLVFMAGWVLIFVGFLVARVNIPHTEYLLPAAPAIAILAAAGVAGFRTFFAPLVGARAATVVAAAVAIVALGVQIPQNVHAFAAYRATHLRLALPPEKVMMGDWMLRCVPHDTRVMAAAYSYVPPQFATAFLFTDHGYYSYFKQFGPDLVILDKELIAFWAGKVENVTTDVVGTTADIKRYYDVVAHTAEWRQGPAFGQFEIFLSPALAGRIAAQPGCL
jgi:hypothetical protein